MGGFYSTPTFTIFRRGLEPRVIKRFHGLNAYTPLTSTRPDWAQDLLNVIVNSNGELSKFRLPQVLSPQSIYASGPQRIFDFQQANGTRQIFTNIGGATLAYFTKDGTVGPTVVDSGPTDAGPWSFVETNNIIIGVNGQRAVKWTGTDLLNVGLPAPANAPTVTNQAGNLSPTFGYEWAFSWKSSGNAPGLAGPSPIEVSTASPATAQIGAGLVNKAFIITSTSTPDLQFDTLVLWRTLNGGGDLFRLAEVNINTGAVSFNAATVSVTGSIPYLSVIDNTPDSALDKATRAPFLNNQPVAAKFAAVGQSRVLLMNLPGAPQDAIYSGYERILVGNPPECFPPNNRLRLSIGAESIAGGGIIQAGVVMFSNIDKMYMLRGQMEDITDTAPVQFTQYLEELPWTLGCFSHETIRATPYGLVWLAADKTVQLFDGHSQPKDISQPVYPILRGITAGAENQCSSAYFNWLERDWYVLLVPFGGSVTPNRMIFWGLDKETETIDIFISTIPADGIATVTTSTGQRRLLIGRLGQLLLLPVASDTLGGIADLSLIPAGGAPATPPGLDQTFTATDAVTTDTSLAYGPFTPRNLTEIVLTGIATNVTNSISPNGTQLSGDNHMWKSNLTVNPTTYTANYNSGSQTAIVASSFFTNGTPVIAQNTTAAALTATFTNPVPATDSIWVGLYIATPGSPIPTYSVTDDQNNTYTLLGSVSAGGAGGVQESTWISANPKGGPRTVTITRLTGGGPGALQISIADITNLVATSSPAGGPPTSTSANAQLPAYWFGGYAGNDTPQRAEMFRWARLITDQDPKAFQLRFNLVDDEGNTIANPYQTPLTQLKSSKLAINRRAKRCATLIQFPVQDVSANVMELQVLSIPSSDR